MYHGSLQHLPKDYKHRPPPLPGQKDTRKRAPRELPPLRGPAKQAGVPPPPAAQVEAAMRLVERPETPRQVDLAEAERLRRAEAARIEAMRYEAYERESYARDLVTGMRGVGQFALQPDFSRLATLQDLARRCNPGADVLNDEELELTVEELGRQGSWRKPWESVWRVPATAA